MEKVFKKRLLKELRKDWEYVDDIKIGHWKYVGAFRHKQTQVIKLVKIKPDMQSLSDWTKYTNEQLRVFEYRKWGKALRNL